MTVAAALLRRVQNSEFCVVVKNRPMSSVEALERRRQIHSRSNLKYLWHVETSFGSNPGCLWRTLAFGRS